MTLSPAEGSKTSALRGSWAIIQCGYKSSLHATGGPTNTHSTNVHIIKLVMHVSHRLREAKKDKKVPPFLFFCYLFLAKKFLAAEVLPGCYGRWQSAPANGGALCIQCEDNVALESEIHFRDYYLLYVREGIRSISRWE